MTDIKGTGFATPTALAKQANKDFAAKKKPPVIAGSGYATPIALAKDINGKVKPVVLSGSGYATPTALAKDVNAQVTSLGNLKKVGGDVNFKPSFANRLSNLFSGAKKILSKIRIK